MANLIKYRYFDGVKSIELPQYPGEAWAWISGRPETTADELRKCVAWLFRGIELISQAVASLPFVITTYGTDEEVDSSDNYKNVVGFMDDPKRLFALISASLDGFGRAYLYKDANNYKVVKTLRYWMPASVEPVIDPKLGLQKFTRPVGAEVKEFKSEQVVYFWLPDPVVEIGPPMSYPCLAALAAAGVVHGADSFAAEFFSRGAILPLLIGVPSGTQKEEKDRIENVFSKMMTGVKNAFRAKVFNADFLKPVTIGQGLDALKDSGAIRDAKEEIATALGIPLTKLNSGSASGLGGGGVVSEDDKRFYTDTIIPRCEFIAETLNRQCLHDVGYHLAFTPETLDYFQEDENARANAYKTYIDAQMKPSIAAQMLGLELPEGVEYEDLDETEPEPEPPMRQQIQPLAPAQVEPEYAEDVKLWKRKALNALKAGKSPTVSFTSDSIPSGMCEQITSGLATCSDAEHVKAVFDNLSIGRQPSGEFGELIDLLRQAVEAIK